MTAPIPPRAGSAAPRDMAWIPPGTFRMGSEDFYTDEAPVHHREVAGFWMDVHPVTNAEFRRFVTATGHVTTAEVAPDAADFPDASPEQLVPGSLVFTPPDHPVPLHDARAWWSWVPGAQWRHPEGPRSTLHRRERHPVTQVSWADALAYARWAGKDLPTEAEWEYGARGGLDGARYAWGDEPTVRGRQMANTWQGRFPFENLRHDGFERTSPIGSFPANGYGLVDVCGNVWEWTSDAFTPDHRSQAGGEAAVAAGERHACCGPDRGEMTRAASDRAGAQVPDARKAIKGGSHLCAPSYCLRYRPAARQAETADTSTSHLGFRCVSRMAGR
jgi:formylglycine-generating enzyme required for sulfatase activity